MGVSQNMTVSIRDCPAPIPPAAAYDALAPYYKSVSMVRTAYLRRIEAIVTSHVRNARSLLDIGSGDGVRALRIARSAGVERVVLVEPSAGMRAQCREKAEFWECSAAEIPVAANKFDVITCLWNVLGHIQTARQRELALVRFRDLLNPGGMVFLDVNYRYNAPAYGWTQTALRVVHDLVFPSDHNGDVIVSWQIGNHSICTWGHVFTHKELRGLFSQAGFKIKRRWTVSYRSGRECKLPFLGNLLYELTL
jgi:ubiquinone/menaquinone biosynthesis C-methylase UbiE